ncbi:dynamin family protein [Lacinutrix undariae]
MEKNILKEYNKKVQQLNIAFQDLTKNKLIPVTHGEKSFSIDSVNEIQNNLEKQEFTISVCGQINAGKSSFLNYLLFNDKEILPADDTPWTAKLTTVRYGEKDDAAVTYYNLKEWELLKSQKVTNEDGLLTTYYDEFLKEDVNKAAIEGLQVETYIKSNNKIVDNLALSDLKNYVSKGGRMTPFVKQVDIKVNNALAKGVVFVDTPGINDRNELRSKVTEDWIKKSCAVIYLFYAGQALSSADYEFIDQHLSSVPTDKILFALTKADISEDYEGAKLFVEKTLKEDVELKKRKFITDDKSVYPISTLSALINYKKLNNIPLNEDEEFHLERIMDESPSFINKNGFIEDFVDALKSHLMTQTGKAIIDKTTAFLYDIYKTNESCLLSDLNTTKDKLQSLNLSEDNLKNKIDSLNRSIDAIEKFKKDFNRGTAEEVVATITSNLNIRLQDFRKSGLSSLRKNLEYSSNDSIKALRELAPHLTKTSLIDISDRIHNLLLTELSVKEKINELLETFSNKFEAIISDVNVYNGSLFCCIENPSSIVQNISYKELSIDALKENCGKNYGRLFNKESVKTLIFVEIQKVFETHAKYVTDNVIRNIKNVIEENIQEVYNNVNTEVKQIKANSNDLLKNRSDKSNQKNILQKDIVRIQERLDIVTSQFKELKQCI